MVTIGRDGSQYLKRELFQNSFGKTFQDPALAAFREIVLCSGTIPDYVSSFHKKFLPSRVLSKSNYNSVREPLSMEPP